MNISVFDLYTIGIGPSSSHTVGPMRAALQFVSTLRDGGWYDNTTRLHCTLYGSLGATGKGHGSDRAVLMGLCGETPEQIDPASIDDRMAEISEQGELVLDGGRRLRFDVAEDLTFERTEVLPYHPNGMIFSVFDDAGNELTSKTYYSIGGGFVIVDGEVQQLHVTDAIPFAFDTGEQLLQHCQQSGKRISEIMMDNECAQLERQQVRERLLEIAAVMEGCIQRGCHTHGILPGGMKVKRRAADLYSKLSEHPESSLSDPLNVMDWINLYALAVNEENAAGGRVVTAPTNGAAGIIPAVLQYCKRFCRATDDDVIDFLLTAAAIGSLYKKNASISGADVGCQGEVGVACSMAAGALTEFLGGTPGQVENAAEIGMEHNLGLTCDPVGGLVQVPCIERNAMGAVKALNAARMALRGDGTHYVTLDKVIRTMRDTGRDMQDKYKETARGGLAVNVIEC